MRLHRLVWVDTCQNATLLEITCQAILWDFGTYHILVCFFVWFDSLCPINNLSVIKGQVFLGWTRTKLGLMCPAQGHNAVTPVRLKPAAPRSRVKHSTTEPLRSQTNWYATVQMSLYIHAAWQETSLHAQTKFGSRSRFRPKSQHLLPQGSCALMINSLACWVIFHAFVVVCWLFSKLTFLNNSFRNTIRVSNGLDPDQDRHLSGYKLVAKVISRRQKSQLAWKELRNDNPYVMSTIITWSARPK